MLGGIARVGATGGGVWAYSIDGTTFTNVGTVSGTSALLLPATAKLQYTPVAGSTETATIVYRAWDTTTGTAGTSVDVSANGGSTAFSTATDTGNLTVTNNTSPVLTAASPKLGSIASGGSITVSLATFINNGTGTTIITDADSGSVTGGIALFGTTGAGTWAYSLDGTTFTDIATVSTTSALLLPATAKLQYTAVGTTIETATINYRAWDTTIGTSGTKVDTTTTGGVTGLSTAADTASLAVGTSSISGLVYVDADNDGLCITPSGQAHMTIQGVVVTLYVSGSSTPLKTVMTDVNGLYHFNGLAAGTYSIVETQPANYIDGKETLGKVGGAAAGTAGDDRFSIPVPINDSATKYNFGGGGLKAGYISSRLSLASAPSAAQVVAAMNDAPVVDLAKSIAGLGFSALTTRRAATVHIAATDALTTDSDSPLLAGMTVTLTNPLDGASETLAATTTGTAITAAYSGGVLTLSGVASPADYQKVLRTVTYIDTASTPQVGSRTIDVVVNDGIADSKTAVATLTVTAAGPTCTITLTDSLINATDATNTGFTFAGARWRPTATP